MNNCRMYSSKLWMMLSVMFIGVKGNLDSVGQEFVFAMPISFLRNVGTPYVYVTTFSQEPCYADVRVPDINFSEVIEPSFRQEIVLPRNVFPNLGDELTPTVIINSTCLISVFGYFRHGSQWAESFTVIPSDALDNEYLIVGFSQAFQYDQKPSFFSVSALSEVTSIHVELSLGEEVDIVLQPYESFLYEDSLAETDISGSIISANDSVAVISGMTCAYVPSAVGSCSPIIEQMLPIPPGSQAPFEFVLAPYLMRPSGYAYRLVAASDNVTVTINQNGRRPPGLTRRLGKGEVFEDTSDHNLVVNADGPIYVTQYMLSFSTDRNQEKGGAAMVTIPPLSSFGNNVTFYAFNGGDADINCYINVIAKCDYINELLLDKTILLNDWDRLSLEEGHFCVVRGEVEIGSHSIVTSDEKSTFLVVPYGIPVSGSFAFLHLGGFDLYAVSSAPCDPNPCLNGGHCFSSEDMTQFYCQCNGKWTGQICENVSPVPCDSNPCLNGGHCFSSDDLKQFYCQCNGKWTGQICENISCDPNPCLNGGHCFQSEDLTQLYCQCHGNWSGQFCENNSASSVMIQSTTTPRSDGTQVSPVPCDPNPCLNGGQCFSSDDLTQFYCQCNEEWTGQICEKVSCDPNPCLNGGHCFQSEDLTQLYCQCDGNWTGQFCENIMSSAPCEPNPCLNGGHCFSSEDLTQFYCECTGKWTGQICGNSKKVLSSASCEPNPCLNGGHCFLSEDMTQFYCECNEIWTGQICENIVSSSPCEPNPCLNGGHCFSSEDMTQFYCECTGKWIGQICENSKKAVSSVPCDPNPCLNGGHCFSSEDLTQFYCECDRKWTGQICENMLPVPCDSNPCLNGGHCFSSEDLTRFYCQCNGKWTGQTCETAACSADSILVDSQILSWPQTPAQNQGVPSNERCEINTEKRGNGLAYRLCVRDEQSVALWSSAIIISCGIDDEADLQELSETSVVESNVQGVAEALHSVTENADELTTEDVEDVADTIRHIADVETVTPEVITDVVGIVNNVVTTTNKQTATTPDDLATKGPHLNNILIAFEEQITRIANAGQTFDPVIESNIALSSTSTEGNSTGGLNFAVLTDTEENTDSTFTAENIKVFANITEIFGTEVRSYISLPASVLNVNKNATVGVNFVAYNTDTLFPSHHSNKTVSGDILSAIVGDTVNTIKLQDPVVIEFTVIGENPVCVFWDFDTADWSTRGCRLVNTSSLRTVCHCNHLTNFAVLVDSTYTASHFILDIISKIGCGLSVCALFITILIFVYFRRLRTGPNEIPRLIHVHLCVALLLLYTVFLVGIDLVSHRILCMSIAAILQCLVLASISWMTVEAYNLYLNVVKMFDVEPEHFVRKAFAVAWGVPIIIAGVCVGLSVGLRWPYYDHLEYCFIATGPVFYYGLLMPIGILLLYNTVTFVWVMVHLCKANLGGNVTQQSKIHKISKRFWHALTISVLMGLTWVFGLLAIEGAKFVFSVIFCVCNSLQGVVIFLLFCVRQEDVRKTVFPFCKPKSQGTSSAHHETHSTALSRSQTQFTTNLNRNTDDFTSTIIPTTEYGIGHSRGGSYTNFSGGAPEYELSIVNNDGDESGDHDHVNNHEPQIDPSSPLLLEHIKETSSSQKSSTSVSSKN